MKRLALVTCVLAGCGSNKPQNAEAYPVGISIGTGTCTYEAPATVARVGANKTAEFVGEGELTEHCGSATRTIDVVKPTAVRIDGPAKLKVGAKDDHQFSATVVAGARTLTGVNPGNARPMWTQGDDCKDTASFGPVDTGGAAITRDVIATKAGTCTIHVELLGQRSSRPVTIE